MVRKLAENILKLIRSPIFLYSGMLRSQKTRRKRQPASELWRYNLRLPPDLEAPMRERAQMRGVTLQDEFELAVRAWLKVPIPDRYIPERREIKPLDRVIMGMRRTNGDTWATIAKDFGITPRQARWICAKT